MGNKVALVLGSGGARGYAHIGVIEELEARGYEIACIAGCSMGAVVGGFLFRALVPGFSYEYSGFFLSSFVAVIGAIIVLFLYHAATGSRTLR